MEVTLSKKAKQLLADSTTREAIANAITRPADGKGRNRFFRVGGTTYMIRYAGKDKTASADCSLEAK